MSFNEKAIDRTPFIPGAGSYQSSKNNYTADMSLRPDLYFSSENFSLSRAYKYLNFSIVFNYLFSFIVIFILI